MGKPKISNTPRKNILKKSSRSNKEECMKKQVKISSYFQKTTSNQEQKLFTTYQSTSKSSNNLLIPNLKKFSSKNKPFCHNACHEDIPRSKYFENKKGLLSLNKSSEVLSLSDDSDIEIIESTPEPIQKRKVIIGKPNNDDDSPEIIPPTPYPTMNASRVSCLGTTKFNSMLEPNLKFNKLISKSLLTKSLASKSLNYLNKNQRTESEVSFSSPLKREAETGTGVSPNAKRNNDEEKESTKSTTCKSNILNKINSPAYSEKSYSGNESSFSILQPGINDFKGNVSEGKVSDAIFDIPDVTSQNENPKLSVLENSVANYQETLECDTKSRDNLDKPTKDTKLIEMEDVSLSKNACFKNGCNDDGDSLDQLLSVDFDKLSPFKDMPTPLKPKEEVKNKTIEKFLAEGLGSLSFAVKGHFGRYIVVTVERNIYQREILLYLKSPMSSSLKFCSLTGFWYESVIKEGDIVHILFAEEKDGKYYISNEKGILVVNPDYLISGTSVVSGVFCQRKAVLNERFKGYESGNKIMIIGSLVHQLFQEVVKTQSVSVEEIKQLIHGLVTQSEVLKDFYGMSLSEQEILEEMNKFTPLIQSWSENYLKRGVNGKTVVSKNNWEGKITAIKDIEENIWSPRFGIKGKIDLTVETRSGTCTKVMPLELKTGRSSFSAEHKGQVTLYTMMMSDRREDPQSGLLLYLRDGSMTEVPAGEKEKKGLIQLRNELVKFLAQTVSENDTRELTLPALPEPLDSKRACSNCAHLLTCSSLQKVQGEVPQSPHAMGALVPMATEHLSVGHLEYFRKWCLMLHMEIGASANESSIRSLWCMDASQRESCGTCLSNMSIQGDVEDMSNGYFIHKLSRNTIWDISDQLPQCFQIGESIVVSSEKAIALSLGVVYAIGNDFLVLVLDRNLKLYPDCNNRLFQIDRCEYQNTMSILFTNLAQFLSSSERSKRLRELIIDLDSPVFSKGVDLNVVNQIRSILISLNKEQQRAVLRSLLAKDYSILKGFPGTGKTLTIVALVRILRALGHSVLLTSYTHSAVDNILLKLKEYEDVNFVRLGKASRIHKDILKYSDGLLTKDMTSLKQIEEFYNNTTTVGTTCLGMGHVLFRRKTFDFCIMDEASQVLEAASLGPLFFCSRFILVGDSLQLPPVIKSQSAKSLGMMESLFERLDNQNATVCLTLQYRMNEPIMAIANHLIYEGQLKCAVEELKTSTLGVSDSKFRENPAWIRKITSPKLEDSVLFIDTVKGAFEEKDCGGQPINPAEVYIIFSLLKAFCHIGVQFGEIGVITPYRAQVKMLKERTSSMSDSEAAVEVNTVDQYQGRDKSVILYSCVRSGLRQDEVRAGEILNDVRRLNVAVTRAKRKLIVVGNLETLSHFSPFKKLLEVVEKHQIYELREGVDEFTWNLTSTQRFKLDHL